MLRGLAPGVHRFNGAACSLRAPREKAIHTQDNFANRDAAAHVGIRHRTAELGIRQIAEWLAEKQVDALDHFADGHDAIAVAITRARSHHDLCRCARHARNVVTLKVRCPRGVGELVGSGAVRSLQSIPYT